MDTLETSQDILAFEDMRSVEARSKRMFNPNLMALRAQLPFLPIMPFTNQNTAVLLAAGETVEITIPQSAKLCRFLGNCEYFVSRGTARAPTTNVPSDQCGIMNPEDVWYYIEELQTISIHTPVGGRVSVEFFIQL
jgi:hypothetical protein